MYIAAARTGIAPPSPRVAGVSLASRLWLLFIVSFPAYVGASGGLQVSTVVAAAIIVALAARRGAFTIDARQLGTVRSLALFVTYAWVITLVWSAWYVDLAGLLPAAFFTFNGLLFVAGLSLHWHVGPHFVRVSVLGVLAALAWQVVYWLLVVGPQTSRETLLFNNPNQLGYFGLLAGTVLLLPASRVVAGRWRVLGLVAAALVVALSLSIAAMIAFGMLLIISLFASGRNVWVLGAVIGLALIFVVPQSQQQVTARISSIGQSEDESLAGRGYGRILSNPEMLVFGASEYLDEDRFGSEALELHSSPGTLLFSYGVLGFVLFGIFVWRLCRSSRLLAALYLLPIGFYGLTHQGLRFSMLWVLLALLAAHRPNSGESVEVGL